MTLADDALKEWFAARLKEHTLLRYYAQLQNRPQPRIPDLGTSVTPANPEVWPLQPRGAYQFYVLRLAETGMGNVSAFSAFIDDRFVMVVRARTLSDDGAIEIYDEHGSLLAAARSYLEVLAWGDLDWLRAQFMDEPVLPPELADGKNRTLWGMPVEGHHCCEAREHDCPESPPGRCIAAPGHLALGKPHKCFRCGFTWGLPETEAEEAIELAEDWTPEPQTEAEEAIELPDDPAPPTEAEEAIELAEDWTPEPQTEMEEAIELAEDWTPEPQTEAEEAIELPADWPPSPLLPSDPTQAWYTKRLHDFYFNQYLASRGYTVTGGPRKDDLEEDVCPRNDELSPSAVRVEPDALPDAAREAYGFYHKNFSEADIGSTRNYRVPTDGGITLAIRTTTDGDDGYLEVFREDGRFLGAARTELNVIAWGTQDWLRTQVANYGEFTPEMVEAKKRSFWGMPLPWDCQVACWQCQANGQRGYCRCKKGHRAESGDLHCCYPGGHTWDDTPPDPRIFVTPRFELRLADGRVPTGMLTDYKMAFHTRMGTVTVYAADLKKIEFAITNPHGATNEIGLAIHKLDGPERAQAEADLLAHGFRAFAPLVFAAQCGDGPIPRRARALAARIKASAPPELLNLRKTHEVTTPGGKFAAEFPSPSYNFALMTDEGDQSFEMTDVVSLTQVPGPTIDVPRPDPGWLGRFCPNWFGAKLSFIVKGRLDYDVMGTDVYTMGSQLATAAVHAGRVNPGETKAVRVEILLAPPKFVGSERNGVTSIDWEEPETGAFRFIG